MMEAAARVRSKPTVVGRRDWRLIISLAVVFFVLLTLYVAVLQVLLPNQIQDLDPASKATDLGILFAITSVFSTTITPLSGALSDRTRSGFGRRTPWIVLGALIGGGALILAGVRIGSKTVIGAGSVVNRDLPDGVFAAGNPCRVIREITEKE